MGAEPRNRKGLCGWEQGGGAGVNGRDRPRRGVTLFPVGWGVLGCFKQGDNLDGRWWWCIHVAGDGEGEVDGFQIC